MSLYTQFVSRFLFPLHEKIKKHQTVSVLKEMEDSQWLSTEKLEQLQLSNLKNFLIDVENHVPYYQTLFSKTGFKPDNLESIKDLECLPLTDKALIRSNSDALKADNAFALSKFNTGGSSGEPLIFFIGKKRVSHDVAAKWRATRWWDVDIGDKELVIWGSPIELGAQDRIKLIRDTLLRTHLIPAFEMSDAKVDSFIQTIQQFKPQMLFGYPSALAHIANRAEKQNIQLKGLGIKVAFVTSERLYDYQREQIEKVFSCPVANGYGGRDAGFIAHQCPSGGMHITAEDIIVEIIDNNGNVVPAGQSGEIVVTHMATRDFPFIRYRTGDIASLSAESCACGRSLPLLKDIQGRTTDFVIAHDGTVLHGLALIYVLRDIAGVDAFKITQMTLDETLIEIVKNTDFKKGDEQLIEIEFKKRLGQEVLIRISFVDKIEKEKSGKFRYVISHVDISSAEF